jgi:muramoyltetrapeptide carboxypeptidase
VNHDVNHAVNRPLRIRIEGASSPFPVDKLAAGVQLLRAAGHDVDDSHAGPRGRHAFLNGTDDERRRSLQDALSSDVDVIWCARGGYGLTRIVDDLFPRGWPQQQPLVVGFSDVTALFARCALEGQLHRCVHGPLGTSLSSEPEHSLQRFFDVVSAHAEGLAVGEHLDVPLAVLHNQHNAHVVSGPLFAANLTVLAAMCGTASLPSLEGHIVVVEEVGERPYRLDRVLTQLLRADVFKGVAAVVLGHFTNCNEPAAASSAPALRDAAPGPVDVVVERLSGLGVPLLHGLPAGHEAPNFALPLGGRVVLEIGRERSTTARMRWR